MSDSTLIFTRTRAPPLLPCAGLSRGPPGPFATEEFSDVAPERLLGSFFTLVFHTANASTPPQATFAFIPWSVALLFRPTRPVGFVTNSLSPSTKFFSSPEVASWVSADLRWLGLVCRVASSPSFPPFSDLDAPFCRRSTPSLTGRFSRSCSHGFLPRSPRFQSVRILGAPSGSRNFFLQWVSRFSFFF